MDVKALMSQRVLILGANGFIGSRLRADLDEEYEIIVIDRKSSTFEIQLANSNPDIVVNCSASNPDANFFESLNANVFFQMKCLEVISKGRTSPFKWVQVGSYFEYQISYGRSDHYTIHKELCRKLLMEAAINGRFSITTIFLPHVFGKGEKSTRLIPYLKGQFRKGELASISAGEQYLPILSLEDASSAIKAAIQSNQIECSAFPIWHGKVTELAHLMQKQMSADLLFSDSSKVSVDASFPPTHFPPGVEGWAPQVHFVDFLHGLGNLETS